MIARFRACWVTQAESGRLVAPATWTRRGGELDEEQDVERLQEHGLHREEVARQHSPTLRSEELAPGRTGPPRRRSEPGMAKDPADGARPEPDAELAELALDPDASPPRVLPGEANDQIVASRVDGRPARPSPTVGPLPPDQLAVPAKERLRRNHERGPAVPGDRPARRGEERPVTVLEVRAADRAAEHPHLMPEDRVLELELRHAPSSGQ